MILLTETKYDDVERYLIDKSKYPSITEILSLKYFISR